MCTSCKKTKLLTKAQFKALPTRKKVSYLLTSFSWHVVLAGLLLFILGSWIWQDFLAEQPLLNVEMLDAQVHTGCTDSFAPFLQDAGYSYSENAVSLGTRLQFQPSNVNPICNHFRLLLCKVMEAKTDLYFWDYWNLQPYLTSSVLLDLREVLPPEVLEAHADDLIYSAEDKETGDVYPCGIYLRNNDWVQSNDYYGEECAVGIANSARNPEIAGAFLRYILK